MADRTVKKSPATYYDIEALPPSWVGEMLDGTMYGHPRPAVGHAESQMRLGQLLSPFQVGFEGPGGWRFMMEPELHFGDDVLVPDLAAWRVERMPAPPNPSTPYLTLAPDWVCEILSPGTRGIDLRRKLPRYLEVGVGFAWILDPLDQTVEALVAEDGAWKRSAVVEGARTEALAPFVEVPLNLGRLWS